MEYSNSKTSDLENYVKNDYNARYGVFMPCKEAINLGTEENPSYSCSQCYNVFGDEDYEYFSYYYNNYFDYFIKNEISYKEKYIGYYGYIPVKINDKMTNTSYCMKFNNITENFSEATYQIINGEELFNCTKCINGNVLAYIKRKDIFVCKFVENDIKIQDSSSSIFSEGIDTISDSITTFSYNNETEIIETETKQTDNNETQNNETENNETNKVSDSSETDVPPTKEQSYHINRKKSGSNHSALIISLVVVIGVITIGIVIIIALCLKKNKQKNSNQESSIISNL